MSKKKKLPIGSDQFAKVRELGQYYVDKTMLVAEFLESPDEEVTLITRPRRFGKTMNMTMMREFFDCTKDSKAMFDGLAIMETEYASEINTKPVIFFSFKGCTGTTKEELCAKLTVELLSAYSQYFQLIQAPDCDFQRMYELLKSRKTTHIDLSPALVVLVRAANHHFGKYPLLLIDEYDQPIMSSYEHGYRKELGEFFANFYGDALKGCAEAGRAVLTGIQRVAKESIFSKLNNISVFTVADKKYSGHFGLTHEETQALLEYYDLSLTKEVTDMYDGYNFTGTRMFNPWSVTRYADTKKLEPYWVNTSTNALIKEILGESPLHFKQRFDTLLTEGNVVTSADLDTSYAELQSEETLWGLLVNAGYVTIEATIQTASDVFILRIPNDEARKEFVGLIESYTCA
ncbi:MAG: AAA family ATPase [Oscillospiraceae bacterium]|nr:AAA family ATPase [Oscillospiraceae bacterium]